MSLRFLRFIDLPTHIAQGGFDHAAVHGASRRIYVAHTVNDSVDVIDGEADSYLRSIPGLPGVAGALVSDELDLLLTSNRGEDTVSIFTVADEQELARVPVGKRPNGLAFDPGSSLLLVANVGSPDQPGSYSLSMVDVRKWEMRHAIPVPGRTRWAIFNTRTNEFFVNIADPACIVVVDAAHPDRLSRTLNVPAPGPHGLDLDAERQVLYCACDAGQVFAIDPVSGEILFSAGLSGVPDVIFFNPGLRHLYVAFGDPGGVDVFETDALTRLETVPTEKGAHTIAFDDRRNKVYAFLPQTHRAQVFVDE